MTTVTIMVIDLAYFWRIVNMYLEKDKQIYRDLIDRLPQAIGWSTPTVVQHKRTAPNGCAGHQWIRPNCIQNGRLSCWLMLDNVLV